MGRKNRSGKLSVPASGALPLGFFYRNELLLKSGVTEAELRRIQATGCVPPVIETTRGIAVYSDLSLREIERALRGLAPEAAAPLPSAAERARSLARRPHAPRAPERSEPRDDDKDAAYTGDEAATVFELLSKGRSTADVIKQTRMRPGRVTLLAAEFVKHEGAFYLTKEMAERLARATGRKMRTQDDLHAVVRELTRSRACIRCKENERSEECETCIARQSARRGQSAD